MTADVSSAVCNLAILDTITDETIGDMAASWDGFCSALEKILSEGCYLSFASDFIYHAQTLFKYGLDSSVIAHFFQSVEEMFEKKGALRFWRHFEPYSNFEAIGPNEDIIQENEFQQVLCGALEEMSTVKDYEERCLLMLIHALQSFRTSISENSSNSDAERAHFISKYQSTVTSVLVASLPKHFPDLLHWYFKGHLERLGSLIEGGSNDDHELPAEGDMDLDDISKYLCSVSDMDIDECRQSKRMSYNKLVNSIGLVVRNLRNVGFTSMAEDAYASAIFCLLKAKVHDLAGGDYRSSVFESVKAWIQAVPMHFLRALLAYLGDNVSAAPISPLASGLSSCCFGTGLPSEGLVRWQLLLEYFAYGTLQDLRTEKLFDIIVDFPYSIPAIEDLKQCLDYTGQHSKLVDSFISSLRYRLLTAGASTNDILLQYVSTIRAFRTIDPSGIFLEAVSEPIREYLRGRKDTIKCVVTMLTDDSGGSQDEPESAGDNLLEELNREEENQEYPGFDDINIDDKQAWINAQSWEPDPVEADPVKVCQTRKKVGILGMIVGIVGSKDHLVNEYRVMLAEKLLNKSDYDIDAEIRTFELLKIHFGESSMHKCEIMLNDLIDSKRSNTNIKATIKKQSHSVVELKDAEVSLDIVNATIISSNFWPPIQDEAVNLPKHVDQLLNDYSKRFHEIKTPRKLLWKKNLGTVKLELQFEDRCVQFTVTPLLASIIVKFQDTKSWTSKNLASAVGVPVDVLNRRINFWISKGIIAESAGADSSDHSYAIVEAETGHGGPTGGSSEELLLGDEERGTSVASIEDQLRTESIIYERFIVGFLTNNFDGVPLDSIHNALKKYCIADSPYDKSIHQLQSFISGLVAEDKLELRDRLYSVEK